MSKRTGKSVKKTDNSINNNNSLNISKHSESSNDNDDIEHNDLKELAELSKLKFGDCKIIFQRYGGKDVKNYNKSTIIKEILNFSNKNKAYDWKKYIPCKKYNILNIHNIVNLRKIYQNLDLKNDRLYTKFILINKILCKLENIDVNDFEKYITKVLNNEHKKIDNDDNNDKNNTENIIIEKKQNYTDETTKTIIKQVDINDITNIVQFDEITNNIDHIIHLADLHIRYKAQYDRYNEYLSVFNNLIDQIKQIKSENKKCLIVLCGDIFHYKTIQKSDSLALWNYLLDNLTKLFPVIVITGNHDYNMNSNDLDWLNSSFKCNNFYHLNETGVYIFNNIIFGVSALKDDIILNINRESLFKKLEMLNVEYTKNSKIIQLYHGALNGTKLFNESNIETNIKIKHFGEFDLFLLGDIHKYQHLDHNVAYSGSLIQQDIGESIYHHGFLLWDLSMCDDINNITNKKYKFYEIQNDYCWLKVKIDKNNYTYDKSILNNKKYLYVIYLVSEKNDELINNFISEISNNKLKIVDSRYKNFYNDISVNEVEQVYTERDTILYLEDLLKDEKNNIKNDIIDIHKSISNKIDDKNISISNWNLDWIEFKNIFCYGNDIVNKIEFNKTGIFKILADNFAGKTSIMNIIKYQLYGKTSNINDRDVLYSFNNSQESGYIKCSINNNYIVTKIIDVNTKYVDGVKISYEILDLSTNVKIEGKENVDAILTNIIGNYDEFRLISNLNNSDIDLVNLNSYQIFYKLYKLDRFDKYLQEVKTKSNVIKEDEKMIDIKLSNHNYNSKSYNEQINNLNNKLNNIDKEYNQFQLIDNTQIKKELNKFVKEDLKLLEETPYQNKSEEFEKLKADIIENNIFDVSDLSNNLVNIDKNYLNSKSTYIREHIKENINDVSDIIKDIENELFSETYNMYNDMLKSRNNNILDLTKYNKSNIFPNDKLVLLNEYIESHIADVSEELLKYEKYRKYDINILHKKIKPVDERYVLFNDKTSDISNGSNGSNSSNSSNISNISNISNVVNIGNNSLDINNINLNDKDIIIQKIEELKNKLQSLKLFNIKYKKNKEDLINIINNEQCIYDLQIRDIETKNEEYKNNNLQIEDLSKLIVNLSINYDKTELENIVKNQNGDYKNIKKSIINKLTTNEKITIDDYPNILMLINNIDYSSILETINDNDKYNNTINNLKKNNKDIELYLNNLKQQHENLHKKIFLYKQELEKINHNEIIKVEIKQCKDNLLHEETKLLYIINTENNIINEKIYKLISNINKLNELENIQKKYNEYKYATIKNVETKHKLKYIDLVLQYNEYIVKQKEYMLNEHNKNKNAENKKQSELFSIKLKYYNNYIDLYNNQIKYHNYITNVQKNLIIKEKNAKYNTLKNELENIEKHNNNVFVQQQLLKKIKNELIVDIDKYKNKLTEYNELINKKEKLEYELNCYKIYKKIISNNSIVNNILTDKLNVLVDNINNLLSYYNINFTISYEFKSNKIMFYQMKNNKKITLNSLSGYESVLFNIMFKLALKHNANLNNGNMLMIDEILGKISINNYNYLSKIFDIIKKEYKYCFIITHIQEIQSLLEYENNICIIKRDTYSYIKQE